MILNHLVLRIKSPYCARDEVKVFGPTHRKREPLQKRGVQAFSTEEESLKRLRGTHLGNQVQKSHFTRHLVGVTF